jgi:V/A-type H+/Na+-transporting ATPase subunit C
LAVNRFETVRVLDTKYTYALGVIRALEVKLLTEKRFEELLSSSDVEELIASLHDTDYGQFFRNTRGSEAEEALIGYKVSLYNEIEKLIDNSEVMDILRAKYDFHNVKVLLKGKISEEDFADKCSSLGAVQVAKMIEIFKEEKYRELPGYLQQAAQKGIDIYFSTDHNTQSLSFTVDAVMAEKMTSYTKNFFINNYYKLWVDLANIKIILRLIFLEKYNELIEFALLPGGSIQKDKILKAKIETPDLLEDFYNGTVFSSLLEWKDSFSVLERESEKLLISYLKSVAFESIGVEPVFAYLLLKENELRNLRVILIGKMNGVGEDLIKERLII